MQVECRRSRGAESSGDLATDNAALAHSRHHHAAATGLQAIDGAFELGSHRAGITLGQLPQSLRFNSDNVRTNGLLRPYKYHFALTGLPPLVHYRLLTPLLNTPLDTSQ